MNATAGYAAAAIALLVWGMGIIFVKRVRSQAQQLRRSIQRQEALAGLSKQ